MDYSVRARMGEGLASSRDPDTQGSVAVTLRAGAIGAVSRVAAEAVGNVSGLRQSRPTAHTLWQRRVEVVTTSFLTNS
jgi:hypothetical protein